MIESTRRLSGVLALLAGIGLLLACSAMAPPPGAASQPSEPVTTPPGGAGGPSESIFVVHQPLANHLWQQAGAFGAQRGIIIYAYNMDRTRSGRVDVNMLRHFIEREVDPRFTGYATLDLEHPYFKWLEQGPDSPKFQQAQAEMLKALRTAKAIRPNAKWCMYGMPRLRYGQYNEQRKSLAEAPEAIYEESDWISPAVYDRWPSVGDEQRTAKDRKFVTERVKAAKRVAGEKPVLAMIHHRYHHKGNMTQAPAFSLISDEELTQTAQWAMEAGADGIVWWGADDYSATLARNKKALSPDHKQYKRQQRMKQVFAEECPPDKPLQEHLNDVYLHVIEVFSNALVEFEAGNRQVGAAGVESSSAGG